MVPTWTDNRVNGSALNKLMSTKFPSIAVVMELSCHLKRMAAKASVKWARGRRIMSQMHWQTVCYPAQSSQHGQTDGRRHGKFKSERDINKPRKETQATKIGGQNEDERSEVRCSCERLASALRLTGQMLLQLAVHEVSNHASFILFIA